MPRRDGTPTAEEAARARQATAGQAAALAATAAAAAAVKPLQGSAAAQEALAQAAGSAAAGILKAFEGFLSFRLVELATAAADEIGRDAPSLSVEERAQILDDETRREKAFAAKARERVAGELPDLLRIADAKARQEAVRKLLDRERRFASQREDAMRERITASVGFFALRRGANARDELALTNGVPALFWRINPRLDNCVRCRAMANKAWPTSVLEVYRPPLHPACGCTLHLVSTALKMGWMQPSDLATRDDLPGGDILESVAEALDVEPDALEMALMEARYDRRYSKGTTKAGEFRPRRGGIVGLRMHHAHHRGHFPGEPPAASPVIDASQATDVREIPTSSLKRGDHILVNGNLDEVHEVKGNGLFVMRDMGLVLIDREKVQGVVRDDRKAPDPQPPGPPDPSAPRVTEADFTPGVLAKWSALREHHPEIANLAPEEVAALTQETQRKAQTQARRLHRPAFDRARRELALLRARREVVSDTRLAQRRAQAREESQRTGKLTLSDQEFRDLLASPGDVYRDHNYSGEYNPDLFLTSDLSGAKVRHYVRLPDGRIAHPDELKDARTRRRVIVVRDDQLPPLATEARSPADLGFTPTTGTKPIEPTGEDPLRWLDGFHVERQANPPEVVMDAFKRARATDGVVISDSGYVEHLHDPRSGARSPEFAVRRMTDKGGAAWVNVGYGFVKITRAEKPPEPDAPTPPAMGGPSYADIERHLLTPTIGSMPTEPGALPVEGFAYLGKGEKVSYKRELRDGTLHLPDGFFRQGRDRREEVVFKHYGTKLTTGLGEDGLRQLAEQDAHLSSGKSIVDTYYALNSPARERIVELHPVAARLVATAAHEQGLPLHPDAAKLITAPKTGEASTEPHPAHLLAERVNAAGETEGYGLLMEAGYNSTGTNTADGSFLWRSHEQGAEMHVNPGAFHVAPVVDTADQAPAQGLTGLHFEQAQERFRGADGVTTETSADPWYEMVRPDGVAVALRFDGAGKVAQARAFTPAPAEVERANQIQWGRDPLGSIKPGDDGNAVGLAMRRAGWTPLAKQGGIVDFSRGSGDDREEVRIRYGDSGTVVAEIGRPDASGPGIVSDAHYQRVREARRKAREDEAAAAQATAEQAKSAFDDKFASARADLAAKRKPKLEGLPTHETIAALKSDGWQVVTARRRGRRQGGGTVYTLRSTDGDTLTFQVPPLVRQPGESLMAQRSFPIGKVSAYKPAPNVTRQRITGRAPANLDEFNGDALGRVDELAQRFDAVGAISTILYGNKADHAAHREWNGTMVMGKEVKPSITRYLAKRAAGEPTTDEERLDFYSALQTVQHEINHGVTAPGAQRTAESMRTGSFTPADYRGPGKGWEESLTEESAHLLATDWLRSYGMDEVLQAVRRHPSDRRVQGVYRRYRESLRSILDDAGTPDHERSQLILDMKFRMTPKQRLTAIGERLQANGHTRKDLRTGEQMTADQEAYYRMTSLEREDSRLWREDWQPVVRPDLTDVPGDVTLEPGSEAMLSSGVTVKVVDVKPTEVVVETAAGRMRSMKPEDFYDPDRHGQMSKPIADGRHVIAGYRVWVQPGPHTEDGGELQGRVVEVSTAGDYVKVETDDGLALWYATGRLK